MTTACHAAAGALVGSVLTNPPLAFAAGLTSHAILDIVPHYDLEDYRVDVVLTVGIFGGLALLSGGQGSILWGMIGGVLPDLETLFMKLGWLPENRRLFPTHGGPLPHGRQLGPAHALWQILIVVAAFWRSAT